MRNRVKDRLLAPSGRERSRRYTTRGTSPGEGNSWHDRISRVLRSRCPPCGWRREGQSATASSSPVNRTAFERLTTILCRSHEAHSAGKDVILLPEGMDHLDPSSCHAECDHHRFPQRGNTLTGVRISQPLQHPMEIPPSDTRFVFGHSSSSICK
jgi:hypothetical protein